MKILVVGAGAVGGYFGARLSQAGRDITFLVKPSRAQHLRSEGLRIVSPHGNLTLQPQTITAKELDGPSDIFDIIFLSVKAQALDQATVARPDLLRIFTRQKAAVDFDHA